MTTSEVALRTPEQRAKSVIMGDAFKREITMALPKHISPERFQRVLTTSFINDNRLANVDVGKVIKAALKIAPLGLLTDPALGEAFLIADRNGDVQARIGYRGLLKLAKQSNQVAAIYAHEICEKDDVHCELGDSKRLKHEVNLLGERGRIVGYYAVVRYTSGETDFEIMTNAELDEIRERSDGWKAFKRGSIKNTPWNSDRGEMAKKTVLRRLLKRVPASADLEDALVHEAEIDRGEMRDVTPAQMQQPTPQGRGSALDAFAEPVEAPAADAVEHDEDGVVEELPARHDQGGAQEASQDATGRDIVIDASPAPDEHKASPAPPQEAQEPASRAKRQPRVVKDAEGGVAGMAVNAAEWVKNYKAVVTTTTKAKRSNLPRNNEETLRFLETQGGEYAEFAAPELALLAEDKQAESA